MGQADQKARAIDPAPWNPFGDEPRPEGWTEEQHVEFLILRHWTERRIARHLKMSRLELNAIIQRIDRQNAELVALGPEVLRNRLIAATGEVGASAWLNYETRLDENGHKDPKTLRIVLEAQRETERLMGVAPPQRTAHLNINVSTEVDGQEQDLLANDPEYARLVLAIEKREREVRAQRSGDDPGRVRGAGERRKLGVQASQRDDERAGDDAGQSHD